MPFDFHQASLPTLQSLVQSFTQNPIESDLKQLLLDLFQRYLAADCFDTNVLGAAHLGSLALVRKAISRDGLVLLLGEHEEAVTRYLYRAWKSMNTQGRGMHFLRTYLQLLYPNSSNVEQLLQNKAVPYTTAMQPYDGQTIPPGWFLTSRLRVTIDASLSYRSILDVMACVYAVIPARFVTDFQFAISAKSNALGIASVFANTLTLSLSGALIMAQEYAATSLATANYHQQTAIVSLKGKLNELKY